MLAACAFPESATGAALIDAFPQADSVPVKKYLLLGMMRLGRFWFGRFFSWLSLGLEPFGVEDAGLIGALVRMRTKEIALPLQEIRWKASRAITVVIRQRGRKRGDRYAKLDSCRHDEPPFRLRFFDGPGEIPVEEKILQRRITPICLNDSIEKFGANDTAAPPDRGDVAQVQVPFVRRTSGSKKLHSLRVRDNFRRIKSVTHGVDETIAIAFERSNSRVRQNFRRRLAFFFSRRNHASFDCGVDCGNDDVLLDGSLKRPDTGAFLARFVEDHVHQRLAGFGIDFSKNLRCDFDQIALELAFVPLFESVCKLRRIHSQDVLQNCVRFTDQLDIAVLDTIVHHLDVVTGAVGSHVSTAWFAIHLRSDLAENWRDNFPRLARTTRHERRTLKRALLAAGYPHAYKMNPGALQFSSTPLRVGEERIAAVDDHITFLEQRCQLSDYGIDGLARFHHHHGYPWLFERPNKFLWCKGGPYVFALGASCGEFFRDLSGAIEHRDRKTLGFHVQDEILAHDTEANQANITLIRIHFCISFCGCSTQKELL